MSTENLPKSKKFSHWREFFCDYYNQAEILCDEKETFEAKISEVRLAELSMSIIEAGGQRASNKKCSSARLDGGNIYIIQQLVGSSFFMQDGRRVRLVPNDIACFDSSRPIDFYTDNRYKHLLLNVPCEIWSLKIGQSEQVTAQVLSLDAQLGSMLANFLLQLSFISEDIDSLTLGRLEDTTLSLISAAFCELITKNGRRPQNSRTSLFYRAKMFIESNLDDSKLSPKKVADFLGVSESYLKALFHDENQSVSRCIWKMRLDKCRQDLANPLLSRKSLSEIAFGTGFNNFSHFSRKFKEAFKVTASEYRRDQLGGNEKSNK